MKANCRASADEPNRPQPSLIQPPSQHTPIYRSRNAFSSLPQLSASAKGSQVFSKSPDPAGIMMQVVTSLSQPSLDPSREWGRRQNELARFLCSPSFQIHGTLHEKLQQGTGVRRRKPEHACPKGLRRWAARKTQNLQRAGGA